MTDANEARNRLLNGWQLSKMYTFEVAARHESFALAAEELSLSPSAVDTASTCWKGRMTWQSVADDRTGENGLR